MQQIALIFIFLASCFGVVSGQSSTICPTIKFSEPTGMLGSGEPKDFRVEVSNIQHPEKLSYVWGSSLGKILSGSGTSAIKLLLSSEHEGHNLTVFVRVDGLPNGCQNIMSETFGVAQKIRERWPGIGLVSTPRVRAEVDSWILQRISNASLHPIIIMRFAKKEPDAVRLRRLDQVLDALQLRNETPNFRFAIVETPSSTDTTIAFEIPGIEFKLEDEIFMLINANDLVKNPRRILGKEICNCYRKIT